MSSTSTIERILVGVDEKGISDQAVQAAVQLARRIGARFELLHAVPVPPAMWIGIDREQLTKMHVEAVGNSRDTLLEHLAELERELGLDAGDLAEHLKVQPGHAGNVLLERAREWPADVILIGPHEKHGLVDFGSTARSVLHGAPCGLWVQPGPWKPIETILVPIDLSEDSLKALAMARDLAAKLDAKLHVMHSFVAPELFYSRSESQPAGWPTYAVDHLRDEARRKFEAALDEIDWKGVAHEQTFCVGIPEDEILERQSGAQLVVMGTRGHSGLAGVLLGNVAYTVLRRSKVPVLALRG